MKVAKKPKTIELTRDEAIVICFGLMNWTLQLKAEIRKPTRDHGPAESAMALVDAQPVLDRIKKWLQENPR